jgi:hypothetical protein
MLKNIVLPGFLSCQFDNVGDFGREHQDLVADYIALYSAGRLARHLPDSGSPTMPALA